VAPVHLALAALSGRGQVGGRGPVVVVQLALTALSGKGQVGQAPVVVVQLELTGGRRDRQVGARRPMGCGVAAAGRRGRGESRSAAVLWCSKGSLPGPGEGGCS
jgi:hypothetical protein